MCSVCWRHHRAMPGPYLSFLTSPLALPISSERCSIAFRQDVQSSYLCLPIAFFGLSLCTSELSSHIYRHRLWPHPLSSMRLSDCHHTAVAGMLLFAFGVARSEHWSSGSIMTYIGIHRHTSSYPAWFSTRSSVLSSAWSPEPYLSYGCAPYVWSSFRKYWTTSKRNTAELLELERLLKMKWNARCVLL